MLNPKYFPKEGKNFMSGPNANMKNKKDKYYPFTIPVHTLLLLRSCV